MKNRDGNTANTTHAREGGVPPAPCGTGASSGERFLDIDITMRHVGKQSKHQEATKEAIYNH